MICVKASLIFPVAISKHFLGLIVYSTFEKHHVHSMSPLAGMTKGLKIFQIVSVSELFDIYSMIWWNVFLTNLTTNNEINLVYY